MDPKDLWKGAFVLGALCLVLLAWAKPANAESFNFLELSQYYKLDGNWVGDYPTSVSIGRHQELNDRSYLRFELRHDSNIADGWPFNDKHETQRDVIGITYGIKF